MAAAIIIRRTLCAKGVALTCIIQYLHILYSTYMDCTLLTSVVHFLHVYNIVFTCIIQFFYNLHVAYMYCTVCADVTSVCLVRMSTSADESRPPTGGRCARAARRGCQGTSSSSLLLSGLELSDTKVYEPSMRALLGTAKVHPEPETRNLKHKTRNPEP